MEIVMLSIAMWLNLLINAGIANSQSNFSCGPVCLLKELSCSCESTISNDILILRWRLNDLNMERAGEGITFDEESNSAGATKAFADGYFIATITSLTDVAITSVATGTVNQTISGYFLECSGAGGAVGDAEISIPDEPSQPENLTATTDPSTGSVLLSWAPPINSSQCVVGYLINSTLPNSTISISTTLSHTLFAVGGVLSSCTYSASVAANDTAGRIGIWSKVLFSFNESSPLMPGYLPLIKEFSLSYLSNSTVNISWVVPSDLLLECIHFIISTNSSAPSSTTNSSVLITKPEDDPEDSIYTVFIAAMDKAGRTGEQSETPCFSFEPQALVELQSVNLCNNTIIIHWTLEMLQCSPLVTNYFITVINAISNDYSLINTNQTAFMLNDVLVGEVYVVEIVPSSALGNGSAVTTTISIPEYCTTSSPTIQPSLMQAASDTPTIPSSLYVAVGGAIAIVAIVLTVLLTVVVYCICNNKKKTTTSRNGSLTATGFQNNRKMMEDVLETPDQMYQEVVLLTMKSEQHNEGTFAEYASPQDAHHMQRVSQEEDQEAPMYEDLLSPTLKSEQQRYIRANSVQETKREALTLNRDEITDTQGYSDLPLKKGTCNRTSSMKKMSSMDKPFPEM